MVCATGARNLIQFSHCQWEFSSEGLLVQKVQFSSVRAGLSNLISGSIQFSL